MYHDEDDEVGCGSREGSSAVAGLLHQGTLHAQRAAQQCLTPSPAPAVVPTSAATATPSAPAAPTPSALTAPSTPPVIKPDPTLDAAPLAASATASDITSSESFARASKPPSAAEGTLPAARKVARGRDPKGVQQSAIIMSSDGVREDLSGIADEVTEKEKQMEQPPQPRGLTSDDKSPKTQHKNPAMPAATPAREAQAVESNFARQPASAPGPAAESAVPNASSELVKSLRAELRSNLSRVVDMFREWDEDGSGGVGRVELQRALTELSLVAPPAAVDALFNTFDRDGNNLISYRELDRALKHPSSEGDRRPELTEPPAQLEESPPLLPVGTSAALFADGGGEVEVTEEQAEEEGGEEDSGDTNSTLRSPMIFFQNTRVSGLRSRIDRLKAHQHLPEEIHFLIRVKGSGPTAGAFMPSVKSLVQTSSVRPTP